MPPILLYQHTIQNRVLRHNFRGGGKQSELLLAHRIQLYFNLRHSFKLAISFQDMISNYSVS